MPEPGLVELAFLCAGLLLGAVLKGATGAGLPIIAVPFIASIFDIRFAVILLVLPNLLTNAWQILKYWRHNTQPLLCWRFAIAGAVGAGIGTAALAILSVPALSMLAVFVIVAYIMLRLFQPHFKVSSEQALRWVYPVGSVAGVLQGAIGLSSPISITFMHSTRQTRETFIFIMSVYFAVMSVVQIPTQIVLGLTNWKLLALSLLAMIPIGIGLPIGDWIGKRMSSAVFDVTILILLAALAVKISSDVLAGVL